MTKIFIADIGLLDIESCLGKVSPARREKTLRLSKDVAKRRSRGVELLVKSVTGRSGYVRSAFFSPTRPRAFTLPMTPTASSAACGRSRKAI